MSIHFVPNYAAELIPDESYRFMSEVVFLTAWQDVNVSVGRTTTSCVQPSYDQLLLSFDLSVCYDEYNPYTGQGSWKRINGEWPV